MILFEVVALFLLFSLATGGSVRNLEQERLRGESLLLVLLPLQIAWPPIAEMLGLGCSWALAVWLLMMVMLVVVLAVNIRQRWILGLAALGIALNALVIGLNGGMPVSMRSVSEIGVSRAEATMRMEADCLHGVLDAETSLPVLGDVIAVPGPQWQRAVASVGDLLLASGLGGWVFVASRRRQEDS